MSTALYRTSTAARSALRATAGKRAASVASTTFVRGKATLPDLPYDYGALEPAISGKIMELHHKNHHQTYVNSFNAASEQIATAEQKGDIQAQIALQPVINFHGGGHVNHTLFWENLAPSKKDGGGEPSGNVKTAINSSYGDFSNFKTKFNAALAGIQGSGWAWLVRNNETGNVEIRTYANQDPVVGKYTPLLGIDAWEHAYYLQYQNRKAEYFSAIWDVINWGVVEKRLK
ncbi:Manganese/iron superoxide dismutase [Amylocarpus encephaloides]|uniref:Superoxide dismutase n=1 Tax=Amylocarpus encephaloides TaxID=45428 RepID=A0A9P7YGQ4_9HELO|nr:Manganese/iron superoxide dismutase [Amylocarpus encephaloides]